MSNAKKLNILHFLAGLLPVEKRAGVRESVYRSFNNAALRRSSVPGEMQPGVRLCGLLEESSGVGQASRLLSSGLRTAALPFSLTPLRSRNGQTISVPEWEPFFDDTVIRETNLFVFNADCCEAFLYRLGAGILKGRRNIAHWSWELPEFPGRWRKCFDRFDEIWTISRFCAESISRAGDKPVFVIPYAIDPRPDPTIRRADFGLPEDRLLFLSMFDPRSIASRKNPEGALRAYCRAFPEENGVTALVLKCSGAQNAAEGGVLRELAAKRKDVFLLEGYYDQARADALLSLCDVFVSLHRSEGFGLPIAEAMALGKNVVVTGWSGNMDYTDESCACCVKYTLVPVGDKAVPPYDAWQHWAEPDLEDAAGYLRRLAEDEEYRKTLAAAGQAVIKSRYSPERCAEVMAERLGQKNGAKPA